MPHNLTDDEFAVLKKIGQEPVSLADKDILHFLWGAFYINKISESRYELTAKGKRTVQEAAE